MTVAELPAPALPVTRTGASARTHDLVVLDGDPSHRLPDGAAALSDLLRQRDGVWITASDAAMVEIPGPAPTPQAPHAAATVTIPVDHTQLAHYGAGMSDATLWRLYHAAPVQPEFSADWWTAYVTVNRRFSEAAARLAAEGATVWIDGHGLQLVPAMLRSARPDLALGYTSRIPFPPPVLFARLPWKRSLFDGLSAADLIGLPRRVDVLNFLTTGRRLALGAPNVPRTDHPACGASGGRQVTQPVILDLTSTGWRETLALNPEAPTLTQAPEAAHAELAQRLRASLGDPGRILLAVDTLDPTRGIPQRLDAVEALLTKRLLDPANTVYVQATVPTPHDPGGDLRRRVEAAVARINGAFARVGRPVIHYLHRPLHPDELTALHLAADVLISTPLSDDLSPAVPQYLAARSTGNGTLILSEFSGYAQEFPEAVAVNPYDTQELQHAITHATSGELDTAGQVLAARRRLLARDPRRVVPQFLQAVARARAARPDTR